MRADGVRVQQRREREAERLKTVMISKSVVADCTSVTCLDSIGVGPARLGRIDALVGQ
jgi:hypothetical protein